MRQLLEAMKIHWRTAEGNRKDGRISYANSSSFSTVSLDARDLTLSCNKIDFHLFTNAACFPADIKYISPIRLRCTLAATDVQGYQ